MDYSIRNENLVLTIRSIGAEKQTLVSNKGIHYLRQPDNYWDRVAPFLFPNVGRLKGNSTFINGKEYYLPQHGFLRDQEFELLHQLEDEIALVNVYNQDTLKLFPFKYKVIVHYQLKESKLITKISISNEDSSPMPFNIGGHPGFYCPLYDGEEFSDYRIVFHKSETFNAPSVESDGTLNFSVYSGKYHHLKELPLDYKYFENDAIVIPRVKSKEVKLLNKHNKGIAFKYEDFITLAIWTRPNAGFICLEPWIGYADRHNTNKQFIEKDNIIILNPLEEKTVSYETIIIE